MRGDRFNVMKDGEEIVVYNWVNVEQPTIVRGDNPAVKKQAPDIGAGDSSTPPEYVTEEVGEELRYEFGIEVENHGIEVIDVESDDVKHL